jgi:threonine aldolase
MVYISQPTENGTLYSKAELEAMWAACRDCGLFLFIDGARMGYGLVSEACDLTVPDLARLCDAFYLGGTKQGLLFGEALVLTHPALKKDFRYLIKQHGGMLAKGWLLGLQFETLFEGGLYFQITSHALQLAEQMRTAFVDCGFSFYVDSPTNQLFPVLPDSLLAKLEEKYVCTYWGRVDEKNSAVRFCTSWATKQENMDALLQAISEM